MNKTPEVEAWFSELHHPLEPAMRRVRDFILGADPRMTELVQYGTVQFTYKSGLCSFVQVKDKKRVSLADLGEVEERADELRAITVAWCNHR